MTRSALIVVCLTFPAIAAELRVTERQAFVYETPDAKSPVLRRLYVGELVTGVEEIVSPDGSAWVAISLGGEDTGFVRKEKLGSPTTLPIDKWRPPYFVRDERPFVLGARVGGETLGAGINFRYQPFTRLGVSFTLGTVIDPDSPKGAVGPTFSGGLYSAFLLYNISPTIELGFSSSTYSSGAVSLQLTNFYIAAGVEWMTDVGFFIGIHFSYVRGLGMNISLPLDAVNGDPIARPHFGWLDTWVQASSSLNYFLPAATIGYSF